MNTITATISKGEKTRRTYTWKIPESIQEITPRHLRIIARIVSKKGDAMEHKMEALIRLSRMKRADLLDAHHVSEILPLLDFLDDQTIEMENPIIKWIGPFRAPRRRMMDFSGNQMALCDSILQLIQPSEEIPPKLLAELCAANTTLLGMPWSNSIAHALAIPFFRYLVRRSTKLALIIQYRAMRRIFPKKYENAFANDGTAERFPSLGWPGTFVKLAGDKFGTPKKVKRTAAHELFTYLEQARRDEIRMESQRRT
jgi:hypothetical protein